MPPRRKSRIWRLGRVYFRRFRIAVWFVILLAACSLLYLNQVGLPDFVKMPLVSELHSRGLDLGFSRLRLSLFGGIVADDVTLGQTNSGSLPQVRASLAYLQLRGWELLRLRVEVASITLQKGSLSWAINEPGQPSQVLALENLEANLVLLPDDQWNLQSFRAVLAGLVIQAGGRVAHASSMQDWKLFKRKPGARTGNFRRSLRDFSRALELITFTAPPDLHIDFEGDGRDPQTFTARLALTASGAETPWGDFGGGKLALRLLPATSNTLSHATLALSANSAATPWAEAAEIDLEAVVRYDETLSALTSAQISGRARSGNTRWASGTNLTVFAGIDRLRSMTNAFSITSRVLAERASTRWAVASNSLVEVTLPIWTSASRPADAAVNLRAGWVEGEWGAAHEVRLDLRSRAADPASLPVPSPASGPWTNLYPFSLDWHCAVGEFHARGVAAHQISLGGSWVAPGLQVTNFHVGLGDGALGGSARLNVETRRINANAVSTADPGNVAPFLGPAARKWLAQFAWSKAPYAESKLSAILPAWLDPDPDWREEVQPSLRMDGRFEVKDTASYRGVSVASASSHFTYSNRCWHLPDLVVNRPEGSAKAEHVAWERTHDFYWKFQSTVDVRALLPLLGTNSGKAEALLTLTQMPHIEGEARGNTRDHKSIRAAGRIAVTNFTFRGESFSGVQTPVEYHQGRLLFLEPRIQRGTQEMTAEGVLADFNEERVWITNGLSTTDPLPVARAIGPKVGQAVEDFRFSRAPRIHINGAVPIRDEEKADVVFIVEGGPFHWENFNIPRIAGNLRWKGMTLSITNVSANLYGGEARGYAFFRFKNKQPAEYDFGIVTTNTMLQPLMADVFSATNRIEGFLSGTLVVTRGTTADWRTWDGYGVLGLRDGFIWEIPLFGVLSPVLNGVNPGLGNSRANAGTCSFNMTNGVMYSDDLEIQASAMRLQYRGTVDLHTRINARVEAELLRDVWLVGPLVSTVFWPVTKMFEYRVTGTLGDPKLDPVYLVPKLMQIPAFPFRFLRGLLPEETPPRAHSPPSKN